MKFAYFKSMKFGITLLILIIIMSIIGTVLPGIDIYNSILFGILFVALTINLFMCSISRFSRIKKGYLGSWLLHFGILLVILFYAYGHITFFSEGVYGVPGSIQTINGTDYKMQINDFNIEYDKNGDIKQYVSNIELLDESGKSLKTSNVAVNEPMRFKGYTLYQTAYGWAAKCNILKSGNSILEDIIYEKTTLNMPGENIAVYYNKFYPDFVASSDGFMSLSDELKNPVLLCSVAYRGEIVKMDIVPIGESIKWNEYEFTLSNPQRYTYIDVNRMRGQAGAAVGAILITIGLIMVFYLKPKSMNYQKEKDINVR